MINDQKRNRSIPFKPHDPDPDCLDPQPDMQVDRSVSMPKSARGPVGIKLEDNQIFSACGNSQKMEKLYTRNV